jgi:adenine-specific DNA-methyltransferase
MITMLNKIDCTDKQNQQAFETKIKLVDGSLNNKLDNNDLEKLLEGAGQYVSCYNVPHTNLFEGENNYIRMNSDKSIINILNKIRVNAKPLADICYVNTGIQTSADKVTNLHIRKYPHLNLKKGDGIFIFKQDEIAKLSLPNNYLKPMYKNSDIKQYYSKNFKNNIQRYLVMTNFMLNEKQFPVFFNYLNKFKEILKNRSQMEHVKDWFDLHQIRMKDKNKTGQIKKLIFDEPKIVVPQRSKINTFAYNDIPWYASADVYFITAKYLETKEAKFELKYILAVLNSKLYYFWFYHFGKRKGESLELYATPLGETMIYNATQVQKEELVSMVDKILSITQQDNYINNISKNNEVSRLQYEVDQILYKLIKLTADEVDLIENEYKLIIKNNSLTETFRIFV